VALEVGGASRSTLDLFGREFVLLAGTDGEAWGEAARAAGEALGVPVHTYRIGSDVADPTGAFESVFGTGSEGASLVRPDGFVAWRAQEPRPDPTGELTAALGAALARRPAVAAG
jgi:hypothetical protein